jgi:chemotaxis family two-component system response regulator PixG
MGGFGWNSTVRSLIINPFTLTVEVFVTMLTPLSISSLKPLMTTNYEVVSIGELSNQIQAYSQERFTGWLDLKIDNISDQQWRLYFCLGSMIWATSALHPMRRWYRQLSRHCPRTIVGQESKPPQCPDYDSLAEWIKQGKLQQEQLMAVVEDQIIEILFDIIQWGEKLRYRSGGELICRKVFVGTLQDSKLTMIPAAQTWRYALKLWEAWQRAGLEDCSPNLALVVLNAEKLQEKTSSFVYRNLTNLADGNQTLRDLAVKMNRNLLALTQPVMPCIRQGMIGLRKVEDLSYALKPVTALPPKPAASDALKAIRSRFPNPATTKPSTTAINQKQPVNPERQFNSPLVACIDDSRIDSLAMHKILTEAGYRCLNIHDPVQALPMLLENKPDLIFLDLVMPIANGYEVCAQIRRVSTLKDTPVIILTSNDGIVDRVRAKMVGSSGFLAKPINSEKVLNMLRMHLPKATQELKPVSSKKDNAQNRLPSQLVDKRFPQLS